MYIQSLDGEWSLKRTDADECFNAIVPGSVHVDLMAAGAIPDPTVNDNELKVAWVAESDWTYTRSFKVDEDLLRSDRVLLACDGLDTLATIRLNGEVIDRTENMHRRYEFDVTSRLIAGENTLEVELASPVKYALSHVSDESPVISPSDSIAGSPYVRKAMYQWGWDWSPKIPTSGIWRSIRLVGYTHARLKDIHASQTHSKDMPLPKGTAFAEVIINAAIDRFSDSPLLLRAELSSPSGKTWSHMTDLASTEREVELDFEVENPELWWPNGYGEQALYQLQVTLITDNEDEWIADSKSMRIGLRSIELRQEADEWGKSFTFVVNGVPIFCKGANWVPADQFPARITDDQYRDLVSSAACAHMNMLRVWGGGIYESDVFYDLCDEYGILVWQDFMFACAHYPMDEAFLQNVREELIDNIRRIRHHPSLALWCGNNEMEWFLQIGYSSQLDEERKSEYEEMFYNLIPGIVNAEDPDTSYWNSSPSSGEPFVDPNGEAAGDGHYWDVWHKKALFTAYRQKYYRFMSEFGFQSLPSMKTIATFAEPKDWNLVSYVMETHQKSHVGNGHMVNDLMQVFRLPSSFPMLVYASQVLQAEAIRYGVEHWRRHRNGYRCMGTLYWQLNDCWPVASWSSIDHNHVWKGLHYAAKRFYAPVLLSAVESSDSIQLHVTNDRLKPFKGKVRWYLESLNGRKIEEGETDVEVPSGSSLQVLDLDFSGNFGSDEDRRGTVLVYSLWMGNHRLSLAISPFVPNKYLDLADPAIAYEVEEEEHGQIRIMLAAHTTARFVMLEVPGRALRFSDNFLDLPAGRLVYVTIDDPAGMTVEEISSKLRVVSLWDSYR